MNVSISFKLFFIPLRSKYVPDMEASVIIYLFFFLVLYSRSKRIHASHIDEKSFFYTLNIELEPILRGRGLYIKKTGSK